MLKALFKKQMLEVNQFFFVNKKTGERKTSAKTALAVILFALSLVGMLFLFGWLAEGLGSQILPLGIDWLYFLLMGCVAILLGTFGCIMNSYNALFHAKDNEMLLSLPIPVRSILLVRLVVAYAMALLYTALVWLPTIAVYLAIGVVGCGFALNAATLAASLLMMFVISLIVMVLSCALGWIVALIALRVKHKSVVTAVLTVVFLAAYYILYAQAIGAMKDPASWIPGVGVSVQSGAWPLYQFGLACTGEIVPLAVITLLSLVLMVLCWLGMSRSFARISSGATSNFSTKKDYTHAAVRQSALKRALFKREVGRLFSSSTYLLNSCLGVLFMVLVAVAALLNQEVLLGIIAELESEGFPFVSLLPVVVVALISIIAGMDAYATPSVSIEGKSLWVIRSLPVQTRHILNAKLYVQLAINGVPAMLCALCLGVALQLAPATVALVVLASGVFVVFSATFDLVLGLISPNVSWTSEIVPLKQSVWIFLAFMFAMVAGPILVVLGGVLLPVMSVEVFLLVVSVVLALGAFAAYRWIGTEGARRFEAL